MATEKKRENLEQASNISMLKSQTAWTQALLQDAPRADRKDEFSGINKFSGDELSSEFLESQKQAPWLDLFKMWLRREIQTDDLDEEIGVLREKKFSAYANAVAFAKANNIPMTDKEIQQKAKMVTDGIDKQINFLETGKVNRLKDAEKEAEFQYEQLSNNFVEARRTQQKIEQELNNELTKPVSDPAKVTELMEQKQKAEKNLNAVEKQFKQKWVENPNIILRSTIDKDPLWSTKEVESVLYDVSFGKFNKADWSFNTQAFVKELHNIPELRWLSPQATVGKLFSMQLDETAIPDISYIASEIADPKTVIDALSLKGYENSEALNVILQWAVDNGNEKSRTYWDRLDSFMLAFKERWLTRKQINTILKPYWFSINKEYKLN